MSLTFGVEEEFLLVDENGQLSRGGPSVVATAHDDEGEVQQELTTCQVESATGVCRTPEEVLAQLTRLRDELAATAALRGLRLMPSGTPLLPEVDPPGITPDPRYQRMATHFGATVKTVTTCGCHVHVAIPDGETGIQVSNRLRAWLPVLLTLTANSPFDAGMDTGYCSWRYQRWSQWPSAGPTPFFDSLDQYEETIDTLLRSGAILDRGMVYWHVRLSDNQPTLEFRINDVAATAREAALLAVIVRGLVATALDDIAAGHRPTELSGEALRANLWRAARDGLPGECLHPLTGRLTPLHVQLKHLLEYITPALRSGAGDLDFATEGLAGLCASGGGAERQRAAYEKRQHMADVFDLLAVRTTEA